MDMKIKQHCFHTALLYTFSLEQKQMGKLLLWLKSTEELEMQEAV